MQWVPSASFHRSKAGPADHPDGEDDPNHINDDKILIMISLKSKSNGYHNFDDDGITVSHACMRGKHDAKRDGFEMIDLIFAGKGCEVWAVLVTPKSLPGICECLSETYSAPVSTSQSTCIKQYGGESSNGCISFMPRHILIIYVLKYARRKLQILSGFLGWWSFMAVPCLKYMSPVHAAVICEQICATHLCKDESRYSKAGLGMLKLP